MKETLGKLLKGAQSAAEMTETLAREGISSVQCGWQGMGLFRALSALSVPDLEKDETHYLLIPRPVASGEGVEFTLFSKRVIPEGYGANNSLPKERVFHLSDESVEDRLRSQLTESLIAREGESGGGDPLDLAGRLEALAEEMDKETDKVSGGMLIVGGLTTLINPVAGIGMMASGVLPKIGGKLVRSGASLAGDQLRDWSQKRMEKKVSSEVERLKPLIFINPVFVFFNNAFGAFQLCTQFLTKSPTGGKEDRSCTYRCNSDVEKRAGEVREQKAPGQCCDCRPR